MLGHCMVGMYLGLGTRQEQELVAQSSMRRKQRDRIQHGRDPSGSRMCNAEDTDGAGAEGGHKEG